MSNKKPKAIEVSIEEVKKNSGNTQILVQKVCIGKRELGFILPDDSGKFQVEKDGKIEYTTRKFDDAVEWLISDYNLNN